MNVHLLIEETDQQHYTSKAGFPAEPSSTIVGVYSEKEKAERDKKLYDEKKNEISSYIIEERPVL